MNLETKTTDKELVLAISGTISTLNEAMSIKDTMKKLISSHPGKELRVNIYDAIVLPSSVIGTMLEISEINKTKLTIHIAKDELIEGVKKLKLDEVLKIHKLQN